MTTYAKLQISHDWSEEVNVGNSYKMDNPQHFVELVAKLHKLVAFNENVEISSYGALGGTIYDHSQKLLLAAIKLAYPKQDEGEIYDIWQDCGEDIAHCANYLKKQQADEQDEEDKTCLGHESLRGDKMGESVFCDGTCR